MFWLGLLLTVCYIPGYVGFSIPTQWAVLSIILPLGLWRIGPMTLGHKLFCLVIAYAILSLAWSHNDFSAVWGLFVLFIWTLSYNWGTLMVSTRRMWHGLGFGLCVNSLAALAQAFDIGLVEIADPNKPAGLLFNSSLFGVCLGLVIVGCICHRLWWYIPILTLGLVLSSSRGGILILAIGLICHHFGRLAALAMTIAGACAFIFFLDPADSQRLQIWGVVLPTINFFGHGIGSFTDLYFVTSKSLLIRPEFAHNDLLQLIYELGFAGAILALIPVLALAVPSPDRPALFAWCVLSLFYFPLYAPLTAFVGFIMAGSCFRNWALVRSLSRGRRSSELQWTEDEQSEHIYRGEVVSVVTRIAQ